MEKLLFRGFKMTKACAQSHCVPVKWRLG